MPAQKKYRGYWQKKPARRSKTVKWVFSVQMCGGIFRQD
jgi:hypothetical protein